jgi:YD repeat-containing protein
VPFAGQQFEYTFDDIGNRKQTKAGGDASGGNLRIANYTNTFLNQIVGRDVPGSSDVIGIAHASATVTVNGQSPYRRGEYYRQELALVNTNGPVWTSVATLASLGGALSSNSGSLFLAKRPETFAYDPDGNLTQDGRWAYTWDGENRLVQMLSLTNAPTNSWRWLNFVYDWQGRRIRKSVQAWTNGAWSITLSNKYVYDGWNLVAELNATNNAVIRSYVWGLDLSGSAQGAGGVGGLLVINDVSNGVHFASYDGNGNVAALVSAANGTGSAQYEYGP